MVKQLMNYVRRFKTKHSFIVVLSKNFYYKNEGEMQKLIKDNKDIDFLITDFDMGENEVVFIEKGAFYSDNVIWKIKEGDDNDKN